MARELTITANQGAAPAAIVEASFTSEPIPAADYLAGLLAHFFKAERITNEATRKTYRKAIKLFLAANGDASPASLTSEDVLSWIDALATSRKPATVELYTVVIRRFFGYLAGLGVITPALAEGIKTIKSGARIDREHKKDYLAAEDARRLLTAIKSTSLKGKRDKAIAALMLTAGLRTIEVQRADVADMRPRGGKLMLYVQGKGRTDKADFVAITPQVETLIRDYLDARGEATGPLFASVSNRDKGGRMATGSISRICKTALKAAGYDSPRLTAHSYRHTAATLAMKGGRSLAEVQQLLRHANINTTMIYQHALEREQNTCAATVADMIF